MPQFMSPPFRHLPLFQLAMPLLLLLLLLLFCCSSPVALAWSSRNVPPQLLPLEGHQSPIRIALGTRGFKLSCPVQLNSEEGAATSDDEEEEEGTDHHEEEEEELIIKWSKDGQPLQPEEGDPRFRLANRARDLRLLRAGPGDAGLYRCTAINEWGHRSVDFRLELLEPGSESAALEGVQLAQGGASAPAWRDPLGPQPLPVHVQAGQRLELRCPPAKANPLPQISWLRAGQPLLGEESTTLSLGMPRAQLTGGGLFSCRLQNHLGQIRADFLVQVEEPMAAADNAHHGNGADAASAAVVAEPNLLLALSPSGNLSPGSPPLLAALPPPPSPRIEQPQRVRAGHTAELQCRVEWRGERDRAVIRWLRQVESSEVEAIKVRSPNATLLRLGQVWLLMLDQHGHQQQQQQQQQDSTRLEMGADGQRHFLNELRLPNVRKEDSGRYFCVVTNPAGQFVYRSALFYVVDDAQPTLLGLPLAASRFALLSGLGLVLCCLPALLCLRLCRPPASSKCASTHSGGTSANGTFASCASASATVTKASNSGGALPPPPRVPPPLLPPCNQAPLYCWPPGQQLQQDGMMAPTTLNRRHQNAMMEKPQMLHRTRAEEEMSRISSHIYASGSPLPPIYHFHANAQTDSQQQQQQQQQHLFFPPTSPNSFYGGRIHLEERDLHEGSPTASRLPPQNIVVVGQQKQQKQRRDRKRLGEEQKMPLIEAQRQSAELWRGN